MRIGNLTIKVEDKKKPAPASPQNPLQKETSPGLDTGYKENYWKEYGKELEVEEEIEKLGVEKVEDGEVNVPEKLAEEMGLEHPVTSETPFEKALDFKIAGVSLNDDQITAGRQQPTTKSFRWLIEWFVYELLKAKFVVSWAKGKFSRKPVIS